MNIGNDVKSFVAIVFLLLGALFGMMIMSFIFGNLTQSTSTVFDQESTKTINETGYISDLKSYTLAGASELGFANPVILFAINTSTNREITAVNYTVSALGVVINLTTEGNLSSVNFTYTFNSDTAAKTITDTVGNNSLEAIQTYSEQADTQFNTAGIAIVLLILIALFAIFWKFFIGGKKKGGGGVASIGGGSGGGRRTVANGRGSFG